MNPFSISTSTTDLCFSYNSVSKNTQIDLIQSAKLFVDSHKTIYTNTHGKLVRNPFPNPIVHKKAGLRYHTRNKPYSELKPSELKYIIKHLHNLSEEMLLDSLLAYLQYFKTKQRSKYEREYANILNHYSINHENQSVEADRDAETKLYLLEIKIGSSRFYKIGISTNVAKRISNIRSDISIKYDMVSSSVNLIKYWTHEEAEEIETKYISEIETKLKYCFNGSSECFESEKLKEKIFFQMNHDYHLDW